jgi:hypothetical protein
VIDAEPVAGTEKKKKKKKKKKKLTVRFQCAICCLLFHAVTDAD